jgi:hypothetical protein
VPGSSEPSAAAGSPFKCAITACAKPFMDFSGTVAMDVYAVVEFVIRDIFDLPAKMIGLSPDLL